MRVSATILGFLAATSLALSPAFAQGHGAKPAKSPSSVKPKSIGQPVATTTQHGQQGTTSSSPFATMARSTGKPTTSGRPVATTTRSTGKPSTIGNQASGSTATLLNPIAAKIASKPNLSAMAHRNAADRSSDWQDDDARQSIARVQKSGSVHRCAARVCKILRIPFTQF